MDNMRTPAACKIKAFHKAYQTEAHLFREHWSFIRYYKYVRPHERIEHLAPAEIYLKD